MAGDVLVSGGAIFVGQGAFGAASQSVVRIEGTTTTVLADGFNSLAGFALSADGSTLVVGDNALESPGATTGDTIYAIASPFGSPGAPASAIDLELLPSGTIPAVADVVFDETDPAGQALLVSDASSSFPPAGRVVATDTLGTAPTDRVTGLDFAAGLATDGAQLFVGEARLDFSGRVSELDLAGAGPLASVAALPGGLFDLERGPDGFLYASSGGSLVRIDPSDGSQSLVASGFGFTGGIAVDEAGVVYALDGFPAAGNETRIFVLSPVPEPTSLLLVGLGVAALVGRRPARP